MKRRNNIGFGEGLALVHRESWAFLLACPLIVAIPLIAEFVQHAVEMQIGMYDGAEGAQAAESDGSRLAFGYIKTLALGLVGYSATRFYASGRDAVWARRIERRAIGLFAIVFALQAAMSYTSLFVFVSGVSFAVLFIAGLFVAPLLARFIAGAPLGIYISPRASVAAMGRQLPWAFAFNLVAILPLMALHYALGIGAIFVPGEAVKWAMLTLDSFVVAWLAALLAAITWVMAVRKDPPTALIDAGARAES